jgi:Fe-Mn family superoxide dismutase
MHMIDLTRREAIGGMGALGLGVIGLGASGSRAATAGAAAPGWDAATSKFVLPDLPYDPAALEPHVDAQTMNIHHGRHHQGYVNGLNTALEKLAQIRSGSGDPAALELWQRRLSFHAGGHINHALFWTNMAPEGQGGEAGGTLMDAIRRDFGSYEAFDKFFRDTAGAVEGSGWGWLVHEPLSGKLMVLQMHNQQHSLFAGVTPLLGVDVWEHAYYLKYQNRRADYLAAFMKVINWNEVQRRFDAATRG